MGQAKNRQKQITLTSVQDIAETSFWDRMPVLKPYAQLARWDRPVGFWLTLWPALWAVGMSPSFAILQDRWRYYFLGLFILGAFAMRGAGCTINDIIDRKLDAQVARTKKRPLPSGRIKLPAAIIFLILQLGVGAWVLFQLSPLAIIIGLCCVPLVALYPLMKRVTAYPQIVLSIVFNAGALITWAALENTLDSRIPLLLFASAFCWTMAYDTVYAHLDAGDDAVVGVKSTALAWRENSKFYVMLFFIGALVLFLAALMLRGHSLMALAMFGIAATVMLVTGGIWNPVDQKFTLAVFRMQAKIGFALALAAFAPLFF